MAIKGKGRTRGRRVIAAPPRPQLVVRKPPLWRRRWPWAGLAGVVLGIIGLIVWGALRQGAEEDRRAREVEAVRAFASRIQARFPEDRQVVPPDLVVVFPTLSQDLQSLSAGDLGRGEARERAEAVRTAAQRSGNAVEGLIVAGTVPSEFAERRARFEEAQFLIAQAFRLYGDAAGLMELAARAEGGLREGLVERAQDVLSRAGTLFDQGYQKIVNALSELGIANPISPTEPIVPPESPAPTVSPSPAEGEDEESPEPSPTASPTG